MGVACLVGRTPWSAAGPLAGFAGSQIKLISLAKSVQGGKTAPNTKRPKHMQGIGFVCPLLFHQHQPPTPNP